MTTFGSLKRNLRRLGLNVESLEMELGKMFESSSGSNQTKRAVKDDMLWKINDCLQNVHSRTGNTFANIFCAFVIMNEIALALQSSTETYSVTFSVMFHIFQNVGSCLEQSSGPFACHYNGKKLQDPENMQAKAIGLENLLKTAHAYLIGITENSTKREIENLQNKVPYEKCAQFLGTLKARIENLLPQSAFNSAYRAIAFINIYARLAILRSVILWQLYCGKKRNTFGQQSAKSIYLIIKMNETIDKEVVSFVTQPRYDRAVFLTLFHPSRNKDFLNFLKANGIQLPTLANNELQKEFIYTIHPKAWLNWRMEMGWDVDGSVWGNDCNTVASRFQFEPVQESDNIFYIRSYKWSNYYVYMRNNAWGFCAGINGKPDSEGEWKILKIEAGGKKYFLMSPLKWPCHFIYMTNSLWGQVRGAFSNDVKHKDHDGLWEIRKYSW